MFRPVHFGNSLPASFIVDPSVEFQPGMAAELTVIGNQVMATVSKGTAPIGIIDDIRTKAFTSVSINEEVIVPVVNPVLNVNNELVCPFDIKAELRHPHITPSSFISSVECALNANNGVITFVAGTPLNMDLTGGGLNAIRTIVSYTYQVPNIPGDDSTAGSGRITVWYQRMFFQTDQYETNQQYPIRANLYISEEGKFTTRRPSQYHPAVGNVTASPTSMNSPLEILWF